MVVTPKHSFDFTPPSVPDAAPRLRIEAPGHIFDEAVHQVRCDMRERRSKLHVNDRKLFEKVRDPETGEVKAYSFRDKLLAKMHENTRQAGLAQISLFGHHIVRLSQLSGVPAADGCMFESMATTKNGFFHIEAVLPEPETEPAAVANFAIWFMARIAKNIHPLESKGRYQLKRPPAGQFESEYAKRVTYDETTAGLYLGNGDERRTNPRIDLIRSAEPGMVRFASRNLELGQQSYLGIQFLSMLGRVDQLIESTAYDTREAAAS